MPSNVNVLPCLPDILCTSVVLDVTSKGLSPVSKEEGSLLLLLRACACVVGGPGRARRLGDREKQQTASAQGGVDAGAHGRRGRREHGRDREAQAQVAVEQESRLELDQRGQPAGRATEDGGGEEPQTRRVRRGSSGHLPQR